MEKIAITKLAPEDDAERRDYFVRLLSILSRRVPAETFSRAMEEVLLRKKQEGPMLTLALCFAPAEPFLFCLLISRSWTGWDDRPP